MFVKILHMETIRSQEIIKDLKKNTSTDDIKIKDKTIEGPLLFLDETYDFNITFQNCTFDFIYFNKVVCKKNIEFEYCKFLDDFLIKGLSAWTLKFEHSESEKSIDFDYCECYFVKFIKTESKNGINLNSGQIQRMIIDPINEKTHFTLVGKFLLIKRLSIRSVSGITVFSKTCIINNISLSGYLNIGSRLDFSNIQSNNLHIWDLNNDGKIYISNIKQGSVTEFIKKPIAEYIDIFSNLNNYEYRDEEIIHLKSLPKDSNIIEVIETGYTISEFRDFIEERYLDFRKFEKITNAELKISNSSVGVLEIKNVNFELRYIFDIENSDLSSIKLINAKIPDLNFVDNFLNYYNVYNDLYTSANKQNNNKDRIDYYRISQQYLLRYLQQEQLFKRDYGSIIAIRISSIFSNHGTNWPKAVLVTVIISFLCFCLFVGSIQEIYLNLTGTGINYFFTNILLYFPQFLNPLHKIEFMKDIGKLGAWSGLIDLLTKIIISAGIFDIIRSFRKHVRQ